MLEYAKPTCPDVIHDNSISQIRRNIANIPIAEQKTFFFLTMIRIKLLHQRGCLANGMRAEKDTTYRDLE